MNTKFLVTFLLGLSASTGVQATLLARAGGMVYDDVHNITWAADANLFKTQAASNPNLVNEIIVGNGGVIHDFPNIFDSAGYEISPIIGSIISPNAGTYNLSSADFNTGTGQMSASFIEPQK